MSRFADFLRAAPTAALRLAPALIVLVFAAWLLWPVPRGVMPMSADHTVHLTRIVLTAERLVGHGSLSGWDPTWFFGFPLGELYPQLGDLLIIAIHALGLGALDWPSAYALGFYVVFAVQGLVLIRVGRLFGMGPWPGLIAALLMLVDAGFTREGGWMYTVYFGVWPQALATSLAYLGLGEMARALGWQPTTLLVDADEATPVPERERDPDLDTGVRATVSAGLWFGAALLAHPIALPSLLIGGVLVLVTLVPRAPVPWRIGAARCISAGLIAGLLAAWWLVPMLQHKAWMASYGWLFAPTKVMLHWLTEDGRWAQRMPMAVGFLALAGIGLASLGAGRVARFIGLFALVQWLLAGDDLFWLLRLDRLSEGFTHIQYQRFLIGAKPGLFLCAGLAVIGPAAWARRLWLSRDRVRHRALAIAGAVVLTPLCVASALWLVTDSRATMAEWNVGQVQTERVPGDAEFDAHYAEFLAWARDQWDTREADYRIAIKTARNNHLFMDAPIWTGTPQYKLGFTPGDNFVHKPESGRREVLDALGVRWMVGVDRNTGRAPRARPGEVARFGPIWVRERPSPAASKPLAWLDGDGTLEILEADLREGVVRARVRDSGRGARVTFAIAGYPRWKLYLDGQPLEWFEQPVWGNGPLATLAGRKAGDLRGGKARGDDGSEPTLIAAELPAGLVDAELELRYETGGTAERIAELASALAWLLVIVVFVAPHSPKPLIRRVARAPVYLQRGLVAVLHPLTVCVVVPTLIGLGIGRWHISAEHEGPQLIGWVDQGAASIRHAELGPIKTDMLIRPAVVLRPRPGQPAVIDFDLDTLPLVLHGWAGLDDDQAQQPGRWPVHELRIDVWPWDVGEAASWSTIARVSVPHEPGRVKLALPTGPLAGHRVHVRITDDVGDRHAKRVAPLGVDLDLGVSP